MIDTNDLYHDYEAQFHRCYICNEKIGEYYYQQFASGLQVVCSYCWDLKRRFDNTSKLLKEVANG